MPAKHIDAIEVAQIQGMRAAGMSYEAIALHMKRSRSAVWRATQDKEDKPEMRGRPKALDVRTIQRLVRGASVCGVSAARLRQDNGILCSLRTVQRMLQQTDWLSYDELASRLPLTAKHKQARLEWCESALIDRRGAAYWDSIEISDEKRWTLDGPDNQSVWQDTRQPLRTVVRRQMGGGSVMVLGAFSRKRKSRIAFLEDKRKAVKYVVNLRDYLLPLVYADGYTFQQDNAAIHTAGTTTKWFGEQDIDVMKWPARSPDLNPIENIGEFLQAGCASTAGSLIQSRSCGLQLLANGRTRCHIACIACRVDAASLFSG